MRAGWAAAAGVGLVALVVWLWMPQEKDVPDRGQSLPDAADARAIPPAKPGSGPPLPARNPFEYGGTGELGVAPPPSERVAPAPRPRSDQTSSPPPGVRLVGFVRRGQTLGAALAILDEVVVLTPGEAWGGYTLLRADADDGVRLAGPEGEIGLEPHRPGSRGRP